MMVGLDRCLTGDDALPVGALLEVVGAAARDLHEAWTTRQVAHGGLRAASIRVAHDGVVRIMGLEGAGAGDHASDVFSLGAVLFEGLAGEPLSPGGAVGDDLGTFVASRLALLSPGETRELVGRMLAAAPQDRPDGSAIALECEALRTAHPGSLAEWCRDRSWLDDDLTTLRTRDARSGDDATEERPRHLPERDDSTGELTVDSSPPTVTAPAPRPPESPQGSLVEDIRSVRRRYVALGLLTGGALAIALVIGGGAYLADGQGAAGLLCRLGNGDACFALGQRYANGSGVARDDDQAAQLFSTACDAGSADACATLGQWRAVGRGGGQQREEAAQLYERACALGSEVGCERQRQ
jgi:hypothetical protein